MPRLEPHGLREDVERIVAVGNRFPGTPGEERCRELLLGQLADAGLAKVRAEEFRYLAYEPAGAWCSVPDESWTLPCVELQSTADGVAEGEAVYLGDGMADDVRAVQARGVDLEGKVAVFHAEVPVRVAPGLVAGGVAALVNVAGTPDGLIGHFTATFYPPPLEPPWAERVLPVPGVTVEASAARRLISLLSTGPTQVRVEHRARYVEKTTANVVGEVPGIAESGELVVVGAHYDTQLEGPGASDNATGLSVLLGLARAWSGIGPRRTVVLVAFTGEELATWGACSYVAAHAGDQGQTVAMVNLDALGAPLPATRTVLCAPAIANFVVESAARTGWEAEVVLDATRFPFADHSPFLDAGIPTSWIWRYPPNHPYYHSAGDTIRWVDFGRLAEDANAGAYVAFRLAELPELPWR